MAEENTKSGDKALFSLNVSDLLGGGKGIEKLAGLVQAGGGRLADAVGRLIGAKWLAKTNADNEAYRIQVTGAAHTRVAQEKARIITELARSGLHLESLTITDAGVQAELKGMPQEVQDLHRRSQLRIAYENMLQQLNRDSAVVHAAAELLDEPDVSDKPVDPDWATRYFRTAQDISSEEMQLIFGKILAGEIKQPGSFSARTVDFLATLTNEEALSFRKLCAFLWVLPSGQADIILFGTDPEGYSVDVLGYSDLQHLHDIGLIEFSPALGGYTYGAQTLVLSYNGEKVEIESKEAGDYPVIEAGVVVLTKIGRELSSVCQPEFNPCVMEYALNHWITQGHAVCCPIPIKKPDMLPKHSANTGGLH